MNAPTVTSRVKIAEAIEIYGIDDSRFRTQRATRTRCRSTYGNKSRYDFFILRPVIYDVTAPVIQRVSNLQAAAIRDSDNDGRG